MHARKVPVPRSVLNVKLVSVSVSITRTVLAASCSDAIRMLDDFGPGYQFPDFLPSLRLQQEVQRVASFA